MAVAIVGSVQYATQAYPGSNNYDFTVDLGSGAGRVITVLAVTSNPGGTGLSACSLDPSGSPYSLTLIENANPGGGSAAAVFHGTVPSGLTGTKTLRIVNNEDYANMVAFQMAILTGAQYLAGDANVDTSFPNQSTANVGTVPAGSFYGVLSITTDGTSVDNNGPLVSGDTGTYTEAIDQGFQYAGSYVASSVGGGMTAVTLRSGGTAVNAGFGIAAIVMEPTGGGGGSQTVTQSSRFDDSDTFFAGVLTKTYQITQASRFDDADTFFAGVVSASYVITQASRFNDADTFYAGVLSTSYAVIQGSRFDDADTFFAGSVSVAGNDLSQNTRFDDADTFYGGTVTTSYVITQASRFDDSDTFFAGVVTLGAAPQNVIQSSRFNNSNSFFAGVLTTSNVIVQEERYADPDTFYTPITVTGGIPIDTTGKGGADLIERRRRFRRGYR